MSALPALLSPAGVAAALGIPVSRFRRQVAKLRARHGFPMPLPGMGGRYDPLAIDAWRRAQIGLVPHPDYPTAEQGAAALADQIAEWQRRLDDRSLQIARPSGHA